MQGGLKVFGHAASAQTGQFHRAVFGKGQQVCALGGGIIHPSAKMGGEIVEMVEPCQRIGGGGKFHNHTPRIQNCNCFTLSPASPTSFHANSASTPGSFA